MARDPARAQHRPDRASLYQEITDKIIAELETGRLPWVQPWGTAGASAPLGMPKNAATNRRYSGINVLILWSAVVERNFSGQCWVTFRQALALGGHVRKGERGTTVVYADRFVPNGERERAGLLHAERHAAVRPGCRFIDEFADARRAVDLQQEIRCERCIYCCEIGRLVFVTDRAVATRTGP